MSGPTDTRLLLGQRVLVTGGSSGIGQAICAVAAREGARVAFTWNANESGAATTEQMVRDHGAPCLSLRGDLRERPVADQVVATMEREWGGVDALVNNAAVSEAVPFVLLGDDDIADVMELNVLAVFRTCRAVLKGMVRQKYGRIVNISSIAGSHSVPGPVHYAASKGAIEGLTRSLAHEVGPYGILVTAVAAGIFDGGMRSTIPEHHQRRYTEASALSRIGDPMECGELVAWLISKRNSYMTGSVIVLDGGTLG